MITQIKMISLIDGVPELIQKLLTLTGDEIYNLYGYKRDESITFTAHFADNARMDIKLVICAGQDKPYAEAVLFKDGLEIARSDVRDTYLGEWVLEYKGSVYKATIL